MKKRSLVSIFAAVCAAGALWAADGTWTNTAGGNWSDVNNWAAATPASGTGSTAYFTTGSGTVSNDVADLALLGTQLSGSGFTLAGNTLTLDAAGFITVLGGSHTVSLPLSLSGATTVAVASGQTLTVNGGVTGNGGMTVYGGRLALGNTNTYLGATVLVTGLLEVACVEALGNSSTAPANLVLGEGTFRYTGPSATMNRGYTLLPGASTNRALAIDIPNAGTTLTIAGQALAPGGSFIKTGDGTLAYTYPGFQELSKSRLPNKENGQITYDVNGVAATNEYTTFTVEKGRLILGAPGQSNIVYANSGWVGCKTLASPRLDIIGGTTRLINGYFTIGRGTGTTASPQSPSMYISGGSYVSIEGSGLVMDNANGQANHRCRPFLSIDNSTLRVFNDCFLSEDGNATSTVIVANNALFQSDSANQARGFTLSQSVGAKTDVTFANGSTGRVYQARVSRGGTLSVLSNSVFEVDTTPTNTPAWAQNLNLGTVKFNNSRLAQRTTKLNSDWFVSLTNILVGASGMTIDVGSYAWLDPTPIADVTSPGGTLTKIGNGTLAMRPTPLNTQVNAGRLLYAIERPQLTNAATAATVTFGAGSSVELSAANAAAAMNLNLSSGAPLTLTPHSLASNSELWSYTNGASRRLDGILQVTPESGNLGALQNMRGGSFLTRKQKVDGPWTATFSYICWATGSDPADGAAFVIHNDPRGFFANGTSGASLGYAGTGLITNSVAVGLNVTGHQLRFGKQGAFVSDRALPAALPKLAVSPVKTKFTVSYDGAGLMTVVIDRPGSLTYRYQWAVNLPAEVGANDAYIGFTGGTGGRWGQHSFTDVLFDNGTVTPPTYCRYGGRIALGGGETLNTLATPSSQQRGFVVGELAYGDQAVVNAQSPAVLAEPPAPTLAVQSMWKLNQAANWKPDGRLAVSTNANNSPGSAFTTNLYPIAGSWTARFKYDMGLHSMPPADYITFTVQNISTNNTSHTPSPGFAIMWRYYENGTNYTSMRMYTNGVAVLATNNIAPVSLYNDPLATMTVAYDAPGKTVTVITTQTAGTVTNLFTGVDMVNAVGSSQAYLGFGAFTGGLNAENIVSDFSFTWPRSGNGYIAFDKLSGSGTLIKRGSTGFGLMGDIDRPTSNTVLRLENGGLVLRKNNLEPLSVSGARSDWVFTPEGKWGDDGTLQFCTTLQNSTGSATTTRRIRVKEPWTITYSFLFGAKSNPPADAYSLFFHNDPRGPGVVGGNTIGAGYFGINNSFGVRWCFYPGHSATYSNKVGIGRSGNWNDGTNQSYLPIVLYNGVTGCILKYDPTAATLTTVLTQGVYAVTNVFTGINIPTDVGSDYAYLGFGGGCGGSYGEMRVRDFTMTYDTPLTDTVPNQTYLASLDLPASSTNTVTLDTSIPAGTNRIAAATVGAGAVLGVDALQQPGTVVIGSTTQSGNALYTVASGCALQLTGVTGGGAVTKTGAGTLALAGTAATYSGSTTLAAGTLALSAACLPATTDLYMTTNGATLNLGFTGKQYVHSLFVNGVQMPGGQYTSSKASWITGTGILVVTYPPVGSLIFVK